MTLDVGAPRMPLWVVIAPGLPLNYANQSNAVLGAVTSKLIVRESGK